MKKVIYIVKSELHIYPPCIAQIRMLKKNGVDVEVWYGSCAKQLLAIFDAENIPYVDLHEQRGKLPHKRCFGLEPQRLPCRWWAS